MGAHEGRNGGTRQTDGQLPRSPRDTPDFQSHDVPRLEDRMGRGRLIAGGVLQERRSIAFVITVVLMDVEPPPGARRPL